MLVYSFAKYAAMGDGRPLNVMYPFSAYTTDVINEYAFSRCDHLSRSPFMPSQKFSLTVVVERSDFGAEVTDSMLMGTRMGNIKNAGWNPAIENLPESFSTRWIPGIYFHLPIV